MSGLPPVGPQLAAANRRILAKRLGWPDDAVDECEQIDAAYPEWSASWMDEGAWNGRPAGFYAWRWEQMICVYGQTPAELAEAIEGAEPPWRLDLTY